MAIAMIDQVARQIALTRWVLPECLHVPVAAADEDAIANYVGEVVNVIGGRAQSQALLVRIPKPPPRDDLLPIWELPGSATFFCPFQVWVDIKYTRYRQAYRRAFPSENIDDKILSHAMNRRTAEVKGYNFVRITPTARGNNSSSAFSEEWAVAHHSKGNKEKVDRRMGAFIQYADLTDLMLMADLKIGGGLMELVNEGQNLVKPRRA